MLRADLAGTSNKNPDSQPGSKAKVAAASTEPPRQNSSGARPPQGELADAIRREGSRSNGAAFEGLERSESEDASPIRVAEILREKVPMLAKTPRVEWALSKVLERVVLEPELRAFLERYGHLKGIAFAEQILESFDFNYFVSDREREYIVDEGPVVIIANHPLGSLDAMALVSMVASLRSDIKIIANDALMQVTPLQSLLLPVVNMGSGTSARRQLQALRNHLKQGGALLVFPAGEVSRLGPTGVQDLKWNSGFIRLASAFRAPIVPVHISGRNSMLFYGVSALYRPVSTVLLVREMFRQRGKKVHFRVGAPIDYATYSDIEGDHNARASWIRKHLYQIGRGKPGLLPVSVPIAGPERAKDLRRAVSGLERLGRTSDNLHICLYRFTPSCPIMREIGRLRELTFRSVGEGTGERRDIDRFDEHYLHILLWNDEDLEIVGAYRLAPVADIIAQKGVRGLYTSTLFDFSRDFAPVLEQGIELGRSFVQPKYWGRRSLHYLWVGIGAYLARHPEVRYMFGPVSISQQLPAAARDLVVDFYKKHCGDAEGGVRHHHPYEVDTRAMAAAGIEFRGEDYKEEFRRLRKELGELGLSVPTLYRQYTELCVPGGTRFLDFGVDPDFGNCIDGFVVVDVQAIAPEKRARYIEVHAQARPEGEDSKGSAAANELPPDGAPAGARAPAAPVSGSALAPAPAQFSGRSRKRDA